MLSVIIAVQQLFHLEGYGTPIEIYVHCILKVRRCKRTGEHKASKREASKRKVPIGGPSAEPSHLSRDVVFFIKKSIKIMKNLDKSEKIMKDHEKSIKNLEKCEKILKKSWKILKNPEKSRKIRKIIEKNHEKSGKI